MDNNICKKIKFEISKIDKLVERSFPLIELCKTKEPDFIEQSAIGSILHSFYNGIENIFVLYAKSKNFLFKQYDRWHSELLEYMSKELSFQKEEKDMLFDYMSFRHFFRHAYDLNFNGKNANIYFFTSITTGAQ